MAKLFDMFGSPITKWFYADGSVFPIHYIIQTTWMDFDQIIRVENYSITPKAGMFGIFHGYIGYVDYVEWVGQSTLVFVAKLRWVYPGYVQRKNQIPLRPTTRMIEMNADTYNMMMLKYG